jgi:hypothetical protein
MPAPANRTNHVRLAACKVQGECRRLVPNCHGGSGTREVASRRVEVLVGPSTAIRPDCCALTAARDTSRSVGTWLESWIRRGGPTAAFRDQWSDLPLGWLTQATSGAVSRVSRTRQITTDHIVLDRLPRREANGSGESHLAPCHAQRFARTGPAPSQHNRGFRRRVGANNVAFSIFRT